MKRILLILLILCSNRVTAAPFLVADIYPDTDRQPTFFEFIFDGSTTPVTSPAIKCDAAAVTNKACPAVSNAVAMYHDVGNLTKQKHTVTAKACDAVDCSFSSPVFNFSTAVLTVPSGIRLVP